MINIHFIFPFIALLCIPAVSNAQVSICLKDAHTLEAIEGAMVYQLEKDEYRLSDALGIVAFTRINEGSRIYIEALGYESHIIVFPDTTQFTVELTPSHISLKELTVTGIGTTTRDKSGFRIDKIDLKNSSAMGQLNIPEALSLIPGVYSANLGNGIAKPVIRGMQGMRVVTMLNAMRFEAQQWGGDHGIGIGNAGVGSAEVIKGPASLVYGADAMGGVV
ncbi:MAG: TonB-dependent receptor plug domain-containing protein, partial [Flavobacteriales bacterium]